MPADVQMRNGRSPNGPTNKVFSGFASSLMREIFPNPAAFLRGQLDPNGSDRYKLYACKKVWEEFCIPKDAKGQRVRMHSTGDHCSCRSRAFSIISASLCGPLHLHN